MRTLIVAALTLTAGMAAAETQTLKADIWVDNWFTMYANGTLVIEEFRANHHRTVVQL